MSASRPKCHAPRTVKAYLGNTTLDVPVGDWKTVQSLALVLFNLTAHDSDTPKAEAWALRHAAAMVPTLRAVARAKGLL